VRTKACATARVARVVNRRASTTPHTHNTLTTHAREHTHRDWALAITEFSSAIELDPSDHVFFSNRSGSYASLGEYDKALTDAEECVRLNASFAKGYGRKGLALFKLGKTADAESAYEEGLSVKPGDVNLAKGLEEVQMAAMKSQGFGGMGGGGGGMPGGMGGDPMAGLGAMFGEGMWGKLQANPSTAALLQDPAYVTKMKTLQANPSLLKCVVRRRFVLFFVVVFVVLLLWFEYAVQL
jgi:stress-induced-phosphoprotein 1